MDQNEPHPLDVAASIAPIPTVAERVLAGLVERSHGETADLRRKLLAARARERVLMRQIELLLTKLADAETDAAEYARAVERQDDQHDAEGVEISERPAEESPWYVGELYVADADLAARARADRSRRCVRHRTREA